MPYWSGWAIWFSAAETSVTRSHTALVELRMAWVENNIEEVGA
jgi:hypothetical protein